MMAIYFVTYADSEFEESKNRIICEAENLHLFDGLLSYSPLDLSLNILESKLIKIKRGGGLWSWKPDVIYQALQKIEYNDILVYADAGCSLYNSSEWNKYFSSMNDCDILALRGLYRTHHWTKKLVLDAFRDNGKLWNRNYQFIATVIVLKKTNFSVSFINEWRDYILEYPELLMDVLDSDLIAEDKGFIENRHDQALFSALIYKYKDSNNIKREWEHVEGYDFFFKQAIRATRFNKDRYEKGKVFKGLKRILKDYIIIPFYANFIQSKYSK